MRRCSGVTGRVLRSSSVERVCALMRNRVRDDLWFLFLISFMYGSVVKDDLNCLYTRNLLWSRLSVFEALNSFILSSQNLSNLPLTLNVKFFPEFFVNFKFFGIFKRFSILFTRCIQQSSPFALITDISLRTCPRRLLVVCRLKSESL